MKKFILLFLLFVSISVFARGNNVRVQGYYKSNGTYVQSHYRTAPDDTRSNNWSHYGNVNPYTGKIGTNRSSDANVNYSSGGFIFEKYTGHNDKSTNQYVVD